jgi:hypothetical protein
LIVPMRGEAERVERAERAAPRGGWCRGNPQIVGAPVPLGERPKHEQTVAAIRDAIGEDGLTAARAAGRTTSVNQAVEFALNAEIA